MSHFIFHQKETGR